MLRTLLFRFLCELTLDKEFPQLSGCYPRIDKMSNAEVFSLGDIQLHLHAENPFISIYTMYLSTEQNIYLSFALHSFLEKEETIDCFLIRTFDTFQTALPVGKNATALHQWLLDFPFPISIIKGNALCSLFAQFPFKFYFSPEHQTIEVTKFSFLTNEEEAATFCAQITSHNQTMNTIRRNVFQFIQQNDPSAYHNHSIDHFICFNEKVFYQMSCTGSMFSFSVHAWAVKIETDSLATFQEQIIDQLKGPIGQRRLRHLMQNPTN